MSVFTRLSYKWQETRRGEGFVSPGVGSITLKMLKK